MNKLGIVFKSHFISMPIPKNSLILSVLDFDSDNHLITRHYSYNLFT